MDYQIQIKNIRKERNITQEELAHDLGVSFATINRWETGKSKPSKLAKKVIDYYCEKNKIVDKTDTEKSL